MVDGGGDDPPPDLFKWTIIVKGTMILAVLFIFFRVIGAYALLYECWLCILGAIGYILKILCSQPYYLLWCIVAILIWCILKILALNHIIYIWCIAAVLLPCLEGKLGEINHVCDRVSLFLCLCPYVILCLDIFLCWCLHICTLMPLCFYARNILYAMFICW